MGESERPDYPTVTAPIVGCSNAEQLADNLKYLDVRLTDEERKQLTDG